MSDLSNNFNEANERIAVAATRCIVSGLKAEGLSEAGFIIKARVDGEKPALVILIPKNLPGQAEQQEKAIGGLMKVWRNATGIFDGVAQIVIQPCHDDPSKIVVPPYEEQRRTPLRLFASQGIVYGPGIHSFE